MSNKASGDAVAQVDELVAAIGPRLGSPAISRRDVVLVTGPWMAGVTGVGEADAGAIAPAVAGVRAASGLPVAVGFGIRDPERAAAVARVADAVVVGSALVECIDAAIAQNRDPVSKLLDTAAQLAKSVRSARAGES